MTIEDTLGEWTRRANVLRECGHDHDAGLIERILQDIARSAPEYLLWLNETDARLRSGRAMEWLRARFPTWEREGHAKLQDGRRTYRAIVIPQRTQEAA